MAAGWLAGWPAFGVGFPHWAQQPTSWRAKPMKLACTHRVRHEEQRLTALVTIGKLLEHLGTEA